MKRFLVLFAVLVPLSLFIAGCGGPSSSPGKASAPPTEQQKKMAEQQQKTMEEMMKSKGS